MVFARSSLFHQAFGLVDRRLVAGLRGTDSEPPVISVDLEQSGLVRGAVAAHGYVLSKQDFTKVCRAQQPRQQEQGKQQKLNSNSNSNTGRVCVCDVRCFGVASVFTISSIEIKLMLTQCIECDKTLLLLLISLSFSVLVCLACVRAADFGCSNHSLPTHRLTH